MAWSGGVFTRTNGDNVGSDLWQQDRNEGQNILASRHDSHDEDLATGINNCITKDGQNVATANLPMGGFRHTNVSNGAARNQYSSIAQIQDSSVVYGGSSTGAANVYAVTLSPALTTYTAGQRLCFLSHQSNTATCTLNVNGLGAKNIYKHTGSIALSANDILSGRLIFVTYDGTQFQLENPQNSSRYWYYDGSGNLIHTASVSVLGGTSDGSDNAVLTIAGGGAASDGRGAYILMNGNEAAGTGILQLSCGSHVSAQILLRTYGSNSIEFLTNNTSRMVLSGSDAHLNLKAAGGVPGTPSSGITLYTDGTNILYKNNAGVVKTVTAV